MRRRDMSARDLKALLDGVHDTLEIVLRPALASCRRGDAVHDAWLDARDEAQLAYAAWLTAGGREAYAAYRAAQDREDAAQDALAVSFVMA